MLKEGHERSGNRDKLLGANVNVIDLSLGNENEVAGLAGVDEFRSDAEVFVQFDVGLRDDVTIFFPRGEIEGEGLEFDDLLLLVA